MTGTTTRVSLALLVGALAGCTTQAATEDAGRGPLWIVNARIHGHPGARVLRIEQGKIDGIDDVPPAGARILDAKGGLVVPGFHDAHIHLLDMGLAKAGVELGAFTTLDDTVAAVGSFARAHPDKKWIDGSGWAYGIVPAGSFPSRKALDAVVPDRPVVLSSYDGHSTWVNTRALVLAGVTAKTKDPAGGKIVREEDGTPQGTLLEDAGGLVWKKVPAADRDAQSAALRRAAQELAALGVTSIDDIEHDAVVLELLHDLEKKGELPVRVRLGLPLEGDLEHYQTLRKKYGSDMLRFGFLKGFVDGVIESKTAYLLEPYVGSEERGEPRIPPERLKTLVARAHADGLPVVFHAIGDAAVRISLDAFEADALAKRTVHHEPDRIEHIELLALDDAPRFAKLGVLASMQPIHATPEPGEAVWSTNLGEERLRRTFPWRALLNAGATLQFGSDAPVASPDVLHGLAVAVTRRNREGWPPEGWNAHQAITIEQALAAYTNGRRIEVGAPADLAILSAEVDLTRPATLWEGSVTATLLGGRITHGASSLR